MLWLGLNSKCVIDDKVVRWGGENGFIIFISLDVLVVVVFVVICVNYE